MPKTAMPDWAAIRHRYVETDAAVADILAGAGISKSDLEKTRKREGWIRHKPRGLAPGRRPPAVPAETLAPTRPAKSPATTKSKPTVTAPAAPAAPAVPSPLTIIKPKPQRPASSGISQRRRLLDRLVAAISLKLEQLERRMAQDLETIERGEAATSTDHERETRAIGALIDNLGKVTEMETGLDRSAGRGKSNIATSDIAGEADRFRRELAERLARIVGAAAAKS